MTDIIEKLTTTFPTAIKDHSEFRGQTSINIDASQFHEVALFLRNDEELKLDLLIDVYGVDRLRLRETPRLAANYELYSIPNNRFLHVTVEAPDPQPNGSK